MRKIFTIGHSSHSIEHFLELLSEHQIDVVVDVRSSPYSKRYPQFGRETLKQGLKELGIKYLFLGRELGARRSERQCYVDGKARYELIARLEAFNEGLERLLNGATQYRVALMCAERDPLTCHRAILICRHLKRHDIAMNHILGNGAVEAHEQAERRLMSEEGENSEQPDMFTAGESEDSALTRAYSARAERIAYVEQGAAIEDSHDRLY